MNTNKCFWDDDIPSVRYSLNTVPILIKFSTWVYFNLITVLFFNSSSKFGSNGKNNKKFEISISQRQPLLKRKARRNSENCNFEFWPPKNVLFL